MTWLKPSILQLLLLIALPVVVLDHGVTVLVPEPKRRVRKRVGNTERTQGRSYRANHCFQR